MKLKILREIIKKKENKEEFAIITNISNGESCVFEKNRSIEKNFNKYSDQINSFFKSKKNGLIEGSDIFVETYIRPIKVIIVGAVHISQYLSKIAKLLDFDVTIIDPREAFASKERFPDDKVINSWPEDCFENLNIDNRTAIVTLTHEPSLDDPAITYALNSSCFYIGALGSKKTHNNRIERLKNSGFSEDIIKRVNGPIGLPINAAKPNEIAISIMSEIIASLRHNNYLDLDMRDDWKLR